MDAYTFVLERAARDGFDVRKPIFYRPDRNVTRRDSLTPEEVPAIGRHQFSAEYGVLIVSRRLDRANEPGELKKRKYGDTDVFRLVPLPTKTVELLKWWIETTEPEDYLFLYHGKSVRQRYISERWAKALKRVRIGPEKKPMQLEGRKIDVQALRVTYRSMTEGRLPRSFLLNAMGHRSADVHDGYLRFLERQVEAVGKAHSSTVDEVWTLS